ncbi:MAG: helix-turn-helix transcriptional regulator [Actinobacteria bacterium]|nr:helix-turn-helix transcriptional regulator [Actinomycetota bacterium]
MRNPAPVAALPGTASPAAAACPVLGALTVVGDFWTMGVLRCVFTGMGRFGEIQRELGVASNVLTDRLGRLVDARVLARVAERAGAARHRYVLTPAGEDLGAVLIALRSWGEQHVVTGPVSTTWRHTGCPSPLRAEVRCPDCGAAPALREVEVAHTR